MESPIPSSMEVPVSKTRLDSNNEPKILVNIVYVSVIYLHQGSYEFFDFGV